MCKIFYIMWAGQSLMLSVKRLLLCCTNIVSERTWLKTTLTHNSYTTTERRLLHCPTIFWHTTFNITRFSKATSAKFSRFEYSISMAFPMPFCWLVGWCISRHPISGNGYRRSVTFLQQTKTTEKPVSDLRLLVIKSSLLDFHRGYGGRYHFEK